MNFFLKKSSKLQKFRKYLKKYFVQKTRKITVLKITEILTFIQNDNPMTIFNSMKKPVICLIFRGFEIAGGEMRGPDLKLRRRDFEEFTRRAASRGYQSLLAPGFEYLYASPFKPLG